MVCQSGEICLNNQCIPASPSITSTITPSPTRTTSTTPTPISATPTMSISRTNRVIYEYSELITEVIAPVMLCGVFLGLEILSVCIYILLRSRASNVPNFKSGGEMLLYNLTIFILTIGGTGLSLSFQAIGYIFGIMCVFILLAALIGFYQAGIWANGWTTLVWLILNTLSQGMCIGGLFFRCHFVDCSTFANWVPVLNLYSLLSIVFAEIVVCTLLIGSLDYRFKKHTRRSKCVVFTSWLGAWFLFSGILSLCSNFPFIILAILQYGKIEAYWIYGLASSEVSIVLILFPLSYWCCTQTNYRSFVHLIYFLIFLVITITYTYFTFGMTTDYVYLYIVSCVSLGLRWSAAASATILCCVSMMVKSETVA